MKLSSLVWIIGELDTYRPFQHQKSVIENKQCILSGGYSLCTCSIQPTYPCQKDRYIYAYLWFVYTLFDLSIIEFFVNSQSSHFNNWFVSPTDRIGWLQKLKSNDYFVLSLSLCITYVFFQWSDIWLHD